LAVVEGAIDRKSATGVSSNCMYVRARRGLATIKHSQCIMGLHQFQLARCRTAYTSTAVAQCRKLTFNFGDSCQYLPFARRVHHVPRVEEFRVEQLKLALQPVLPLDPLTVSPLSVTVVSVLTFGSRSRSNLFLDLGFRYRV